jgi:hypothetical protein
MSKDSVVVYRPGPPSVITCVWSNTRSASPVATTTGITTVAAGTVAAGETKPPEAHRSDTRYRPGRAVHSEARATSACSVAATPLWVLFMPGKRGRDINRKYPRGEHRHNDQKMTASTSI